MAPDRRTTFSPPSPRRFFLFTLLAALFWAATAGTATAGLDFPALLAESLAVHGSLQPGLVLVTRGAQCPGVVQDHQDLAYCVDRAAVWDPARSGFSVIDTLNLTANPHGASTDYTARASGYFKVESQGTWRFATNSAGPSEVEIDGQVVASWYGEHPADPEWRHSGAIDLAPGWHLLTYPKFNIHPCLTAAKHGRL